MSSNKFETALKSTLNNEKTLTENGGVAYKTSGKKLVDINFAVSTLRKADESTITTKFSEAFYENPVKALRWLFFARDIRGKGLGERRLFKVCMKWLAENRPAVVEAVIPLVMEYGRADDLFVLEGTSCWEKVITTIDKQLASDSKNADAHKPISLLAKWMPSANASSVETRRLGKIFAAKLDLTDRQYRKMLSRLRSYLDVVEVKTSANKWDEINYNTVSSHANLKYKNAFLKNDTERRKQWLADLSSGKTEAKINVGTLNVTDIVHRYTGSTGWSCCCALPLDQLLEEAWKNLPTTFDTTRNVIAVVDGSGSMCSRVGSSTMSALEVANALGLYFAERLNGPFKNKFITFSRHPQYVDFSKCNSLREKLDYAYKHDECSNTDIHRTMKLILDTAISNNLKQEDIPDVLILSDMQFDVACGYGWGGSMPTSEFDRIAKDFELHGYKLPKITFWNICGRMDTFPIQQNELGVALVSGFSQNVCNMVMTNKTDPYDVILEAIDNARYDAVENAVVESNALVA